MHTTAGVRTFRSEPHCESPMPSPASVIGTLIARVRGSGTLSVVAVIVELESCLVFINAVKVAVSCVRPPRIKPCQQLPFILSAIHRILKRPISSGSVLILRHGLIREQLIVLPFVTLPESV